MKQYMYTYYKELPLLNPHNDVLIYETDGELVYIMVCWIQELLNVSGMLIYYSSDHIRVV